MADDLSGTADVPGTSFALVTSRLVIIPTPQAVSAAPYRALYASLHANQAFCNMGFGHHFPPQHWTDEDTQKTIKERDIQRCWQARGLGDLAVGLRSGIKGEDLLRDLTATKLGEATGSEVGILEGASYDTAFNSGPGNRLTAVQWVGYAGVRDGTTTSMPARDAGDKALPPWQELIEVRYGVAPDHWGTGIAREAAEAVMLWAATRKGVRRFIAETQMENSRSGRVLEKMGFVKLNGIDLWKEEGQQEWARPVPSELICRE